MLNIDDKWIIKHYPGYCSKEFLNKYNEYSGQNISIDQLRRHIARVLKLSNNFRDNEWNDDWIIKHYNGKCSVYLWQSYIKETGHNVTIDTLRHHIKKSLKINSTCYIPKEIIDMMYKYYEKIGLRKTTELINTTFNKKYSIDSIQHKAKKLGLRVPKELANANANPIIDPIGTIREEPSTGYMVIKIKKDKWIKYNRYLYEQSNGPIPSNHSVIFLDGDNRNFDISNLLAIPTKYVVYMNTNKIRSSDPEITKTAIKWCELYDLFKNKGEYVK